MSKAFVRFGELSVLTAAYNTKALKCKVLGTLSSLPVCKKWRELEEVLVVAPMQSIGASHFLSLSLSLYLPRIKGPFSSSIFLLPLKNNRGAKKTGVRNYTCIPSFGSLLFWDNQMGWTVETLEPGRIFETV